MTGAVNRRFVLAARPVGLPKESDFRLEEAPVPAPAEGEALVRALYLSLDPYMRGRMAARRSYAPPIGLGEVMIGAVVGEVAASRNPRFAVGDIVEGRLGWQTHAVSDGAGLRKVDPALGPVTTALGVLGMTGLTAWFGLTEIGRPRPGDTVVVTAAAGAVGSVAAQLARIAGCRVVGIAGGARKAAYLTEELGLDAGIDYRGATDLAAAVAAACPDGVDVYFDNVGGSISDIVLDHLATGARVVVCGAVSQTSLAEPEPGPRVQSKLLAAQASMQAFLVTRFAEAYEPARARLAGLLGSGRLRHREDIVEGFESAPRAFIGMLRGENFGKLLVKVAEGGTR